MRMTMMNLLVRTSLSLLLLATAAAATAPARSAFVTRTLEANTLLTNAEASTTDEEQPHQRRLVLDRPLRRRHVRLRNHDNNNNNEEEEEDEPTLLNNNQHRKEEETLSQNNQGTKGASCDQALLTCLPEQQCAECFRFLYEKSVDWGTVTPQTECDDVLDYLGKKNYCPGLEADLEGKAVFCSTFAACAVWDDDETDDGGQGGNPEPALDCSKLEECAWPGMHPSFIGDGICHNGMEGCYNHMICDYDGGDCCEDSCVSHHLEFVDCGHDGFACRDPNSTKCDSDYTWQCPNNAEDNSEVNPNPPDTECAEDETLYRLVMYDSFGDGWDATSMTISPTNNRNDIVFNGGLASGHTGTRYICFKKDSTCYHADLSGGEWGNEISWEVKPIFEGAPALAGGGSPMSCDFSVGGNKDCANTCTGKPNLPYNNDPQYKEFKDMYNCIEEKCIIQVGACEKDATCSTCLEAEKADYCYGSDDFLALVDCTMCSCTARVGSEFCSSKLTPGFPKPNKNDSNNKIPAGVARPCSSAETMKGSNAVLTFAGCTAFDEVSIMVTDFDENNFGELDSFESCAHSFNKEENHGGHTALGCMQILVNAQHAAMDDDDTKAQAVSALAEMLYQDAANFCECASSASNDCPLCSSFIHVKTLLYESLDACHSLDEIDCDAWSEFHVPCKNNLMNKFESIDFSNDEQCQFVHATCGGAGPFPAFRKLDCASEVPKPAWDFYTEYSRACLDDDSDGNYEPQPTTPTPKPYYPPGEPYSPSDGIVVPVPPQSAPTLKPTEQNGNRPTPKPYIPSGGGKPYFPSPESGKDSASSPDYKSPSSEKKSHWKRNFFFVAVVACAGFFYYKRRSDQFSFVRYRTTRNYAGGESEMYNAPYSGLTMDSSNAFQPPSLPPTPSSMGGSMG